MGPPPEQTPEREPELTFAGPDSDSGANGDAMESSESASEAASASEPELVEAKKPKIRRDAGTSGAEPSDGEAKPKGSRGKKRQGLEPNNVRKLRQEAMMSKAELARRAGVSPLTIDRVEAGAPCRMDTKRKILEALGLKPSARTEVWPDIDDQS